ncbi:hypothetical protein CEXT_78001 [Caerostris extrusa]|uniref:Uncharacterized protein n=1 Tax=Caerostris extrusa TaxID=172846 RepID=A0AAV4QEB8_CAEEX|nr:hypothetical protein CEXT_78001 [Caerostris extrusa]
MSHRKGIPSVSATDTKSEGRANKLILRRLREGNRIHLLRALAVFKGLRWTIARAPWGPREALYESPSRVAYTSSYKTLKAPEFFEWVFLRVSWKREDGEFVCLGFRRDSKINLSLFL